jgi:transposase
MRRPLWRIALAIASGSLSARVSLIMRPPVSTTQMCVSSRETANCKMCDVDPVSYLSDTLRALLDGHPRNRIEDLMPWKFAAASSRAA